MGLFDKKKTRKDEFDSPMESIDLNQIGGGDRPDAVPAPVAAPAALAAPAAPSLPSAVAAPRPAPAPPQPASPDSDSYGIDKAIELMRTLPSENIQLVVQVVKFSLESVGIKLPVIIDDAIRRQKDLRGRVDVLKSEITELEQEIAQRRAEIDKHEGDFRETTMVRERLELAEGVARPKPDAAGEIAPRAARSTGPIAPLAPLTPNAPIPPPPKK